MEPSKRGVEATESGSGMSRADRGVEATESGNGIWQWAFANNDAGVDWAEGGDDRVGAFAAIDGVLATAGGMACLIVVGGEVIAGVGQKIAVSDEEASSGSQSATGGGGGEGGDGGEEGPDAG